MRDQLEDVEVISIRITPYSCLYCCYFTGKGIRCIQNDAIWNLKAGNGGRGIPGTQRYDIGRLDCPVEIGKSVGSHLRRVRWGVSNLQGYNRSCHTYGAVHVRAFYLDLMKGISRI